MAFQLRQHSVLPGFGATMGITMLYLSLIVLIPLSTIFIRAAGFSAEQFWETVTTPRLLAALRLSFGAALAGAIINSIFGLLVAWVLVRYLFPGRRIVDSIVDIPFALPTAVAGIALTAVYSANGCIGRYAESLGIKIAFTPVGVILALTFIGLPFVVRSVQPVLADLDRETEEAASTLGAGRLQIFVRLILPYLSPSLLTGFSLAFARAIGEYGSVIFISGNIPMKTEIVPLLIVTRLEQYDVTGATAVAVVMLLASFLMLLLINLLQWWSRSRR